MKALVCELCGGNDFVIIGMACSNYVYTQRKNGYGIEVSNDSNKTITLFNNVGSEFMTTLENIAKKIPEENKTNRIFYYQLALKHADFILRNGKLAKPQYFKDIIMQYHQILHELDPNHIVPEQASTYEVSGGLVALSLIIPLVGIILGVTNISKKKSSGKTYLIVGIVNLLFVACNIIPLFVIN